MNLGKKQSFPDPVHSFAGNSNAGNLYPVDLNLGGGIMPGSEIPVTGNFQ